MVQHFSLGSLQDARAWNTVVCFVGVFPFEDRGK